MKSPHHNSTRPQRPYGIDDLAADLETDPAGLDELALELIAFADLLVGANALVLRDERCPSCDARLCDVQSKPLASNLRLRDEILHHLIPIVLTYPEIRRDLSLLRDRDELAVIANNAGCRVLDIVGRLHLNIVRLNQLTHEGIKLGCFDGITVVSFKCQCRRKGTAGIVHDHETTVRVARTGEG